MRIRSVSPDLCVSETMAGVSAELERTFVRLWTHCDDEGRCIDNPRLIKAAIYPLHDEISADVLDAELDELAELGLVVRYEADGKRLVAVVSWDEYQHPQRPTPSKYERPPGGLMEAARTCTRTLAEASLPGEGEGEGEGDTLSTSSTVLAIVPEPEDANTVVKVFDAWRDATGKHKAQLDEKRRRAIRKALDVYPVHDVLAAVRGWRHFKHNRGENDRGRPFNDVTLLLRDAEHIERFRDAELAGERSVDYDDPDHWFDRPARNGNEP